jgi:hypothetical protein
MARIFEHRPDARLSGTLTVQGRVNMVVPVTV